MSSSEEGGNRVTTGVEMGWPVWTEKGCESQVLEQPFLQHACCVQLLLLASSLPPRKQTVLISQKSFLSLSRALLNHPFLRKTSGMIEPFWCAASVLRVRRARVLFSACSLSLESSLTPKPLQLSLSSAEPSAQAPHLVCFCVELSLNPSGSLTVFREAGAWCQPGTRADSFPYTQCWFFPSSALPERACF